MTSSPYPLGDRVHLGGDYCTDCDEYFPETFGIVVSHHGPGPGPLVQAVRPEHSHDDGHGFVRLYTVERLIELDLAHRLSL